MRSDPAQRQAVAALQSLYEALQASLEAGSTTRQRGWRSWLRGLGKPAAPAIAPPHATGLYLWGGVGRGKTWLMDLFHASLPAGVAQRTHFHEFMVDVHAALKKLRDQQDPLQQVADDIAARARVLCFDEFHVADIADAMILARLLERLLERGVALVATSNDPPAQLYRDGLQRARFLPAIALIEQRLVVRHLDSPTDYRLRNLTDAELYHAPLDAGSDALLCDAFIRMAPLAVCEPTTLRVNDRAVAARASGEGVAWFDFAALCETPRSPADYLEIARTHHTVLLGNVPAMDDTVADASVRFVHLVDVLYDQRVKLILTAAVAVEALYTGRRLGLRFERTRSRLTEMRTHEYLAAAHRPGIVAAPGQEADAALMQSDAAR